MLSIDFTKIFKVKLQFEPHCAYKSNHTPFYFMKLLWRCIGL
jgi:hypothetical protein